MRSLWMLALLALCAPNGGAVSDARAAETAVADVERSVDTRVAETVRTGVEFSVEPGSVQIEVDGRVIGLAKDVDFVKTKPGRHHIRLVRGGDEIQLELEVAKGQVVQFTYEF